MLKSALYIVPTPIGNRDDITKRAIKVLEAATLIAAEDTRHSKTLLDFLGIGSKKLISCHDHNEEMRASLIIDEVKKGGIVALVSDAGTPLISDPGYRVVSICTKEHIDIVPLPGACAAITALEASGMPTDKFLFKGFLPVKEKELTDIFVSLKNNDTTTVFYESPRRILSTLKVIEKIIPDIPLCVCRELTKTFESFYRGRAGEIIEILESDDNHIKGEFVLIVGPCEKSDNQGLDDNVKEALLALSEFVPSKVLSKTIATLTHTNKNDLYAFLMEHKA